MLLEAKNLHSYYEVRSGLLNKVDHYVKAVNGVSLNIDEGEIFSVVGESGCGKSTLGFSLMGLTPIRSGRLRIMDREIDIKKSRSWDFSKKDVQIVFQDPYTSLNPRLTIFEILAEPMIFHKVCRPKQAHDAVASLLEKVGLHADYMKRFPHSFSGGQRQRVAIARVLGIQPKLIICDEIVSALDVSVQAQVLEMLLRLKEEMGVSLLFISHDLALVQNISDRVMVMYLGKMVECAKTKDLFSKPAHPYTQALIQSVPTMKVGHPPKILKGEVPSPVNLPSGCSFASRCESVSENCTETPPELKSEQNRQVACYHPTL